jgi:hypothetical protein
MDRRDQDTRLAGVDQGGMKQTGSGSYDFSQPSWDVPKSELRDQIENLDSFIIVGTKQGQPFVASTDSKHRAQQLLREHVNDLIPQNA